ncbi:hypothetical protein [Agrobacterium tumefaciens]|uniref:hypothetical protein n=1 Tax=Agrobacterium tumefaciens TaxID=358 RepID=UPI0012B80489|nr:hypothetical protein [Agrobacterium tumefaciens]
MPSYRSVEQEFAEFSGVGTVYVDRIYAFGAGLDEPVVGVDAASGARPIISRTRSARPSKSSSIEMTSRSEMVEEWDPHCRRTAALPTQSSI